MWEKKIWLSSSPYCNPLDYIKGGVAKLHFSRATYNSMASLMMKVMEVMASPDRDTVARACVQTQETGSGDC